MTMKQKKFFDALLTSRSYADAARTAGYSESSCRVSASKNITKYNTLVADLLDSAGVSVPLLGQVVSDGLASKDERTKLQYLKFIMQLIEKMSDFKQDNNGLFLNI